MSATGILRLGDLAPKTQPVEVLRAGEPVTLWAWPSGPHCPGFVKAKVARALATYQAAAAADATDDEAWDEYLRDVLLSVIDGLLYPEAEVLAGQQALAVDTLRALGWARSKEAKDDPPEAQGEAPSSTTAGSSPVSASATRSRRRRS